MFHRKRTCRVSLISCFALSAINILCWGLIRWHAWHKSKKSLLQHLSVLSCSSSISFLKISILFLITYKFWTIFVWILLFFQLFLNWGLFTCLGLLNRYWWMQDQYPISEEDVLLFKTSISFVDHLQEFLGAILACALLIIPPYRMLKYPKYIVDFLKV